MRKLLIAAAAATLAFSSVAFAAEGADTMSTTTSGASATNQMSPEDCAKAWAACKNDQCRKDLEVKNGCKVPPTGAPQQ